MQEHVPTTCSIDFQLSARKPATAVPEVVGMSAQSRQIDLKGQRVRGRPPSDPYAAALDHLPPSTAFEEIGVWAQLAKERDTQRVLRWIDRARVESAIVRRGGDR